MNATGRHALVCHHCKGVDNGSREPPAIAKFASLSLDLIHCNDCLAIASVSVADPGGFHGTPLSQESTADYVAR